MDCIYSFRKCYPRTPRKRARRGDFLEGVDVCLVITAALYCKPRAFVFLTTSQTSLAVLDITLALQRRFKE